MRMAAWISLRIIMSNRSIIKGNVLLSRAKLRILLKISYHIGRREASGGHSSGSAQKPSR